MNETLEQMDAAAVEAEKEFKKLKTASQVAEWWAKWYLKAGHKRLGRLLVSIHKNKK